MHNYYGLERLELLRFAEELKNPADLFFLTGKPKDHISKVLQIGNFVLLKLINKETLLLVLVISHSDNHIIVSDRTEFNELYNQTVNYTKSFSESLYDIDRLMIENVFVLSSPTDPDTIRAFKMFKRDFRQKIQSQREYYEKVLKYKYFQSYNSKKELPHNLYTQRDDFNRIKDSNDDIHDLFEYDCVYHLNNFLYRLKQTQNSEAKMLYTAIEEVNREKLKDIPFEDFGLLDNEILISLQTNGNVFEYYLMKGYLNGVSNLPLIIDLYLWISSNKGLYQKNEAINVFNLLTQPTLVKLDNEQKALIKKFILDKVEFYYLSFFD